MGNWRRQTIGDLVTLQRGIDLPEGARRPGNVPIMGSFGITGWHDRAASKGPGVTVGRSGASAGTVCYVDGDFWPLNTCLYVKDFKGNNPRFAYYFLKTFDLAGLNSGSAQPSLNRNFVHPVSATFPEPPEQQAIASVLGALDDKIELNQRMNETLEAMARAIFRDWFVDFGPTRARMEGREPYFAPDIWSLFPDRLDDEGKPEGWRTGKLGDFVLQRVERAEPSDWTVSNPYVPIDVIGAKSLSLLESRPGAEARSSLTRFYRGDFLFGAMRPYFHKVCIAPFDGTTRTTVFVLAPRQPRDYSFSCMLLHDPMTIDYATNHSTGTTIPYATWNGSLEEMPVTIPTPEIRQAFHSVVHPILLKLPTTYFENRTLAATRDLLLPKLMSGDIRLNDAEKIAGEAI